MTTLEIRLLALVGHLLSAIVAVALVATAAGLVALVRLAAARIRARRASVHPPAPGAVHPVPRLKEAA